VTRDPSLHGDLPPGALDERLARLSSVSDPVRRRLYLHVAASPSPVSRDDAASAAGISRSLAAFHLDRLVDAGLLAATYRRLTGRTGPGAGRPAKLYGLAADLDVSVPPRRTDLAAAVYADALTGIVASDPAAVGAVSAAARRQGAALGEAARALSGPSPSAAVAAASSVEVLGAAGFSPRLVGGVVHLGACPFRDVARTHQGLTCAMNRELLAGFADGLGAAGFEPVAEVADAPCCFALSARGSGLTD